MRSGVSQATSSPLSVQCEHYDNTLFTTHTAPFSTHCFWTTRTLLLLHTIHYKLWLEPQSFMITNHSLHTAPFTATQQHNSVIRCDLVKRVWFICLYREQAVLSIVLLFIALLFIIPRSDYAGSFLSI